jgi:RimJ/RimL family protein N-acetyltransferase
MILYGHPEAVAEWVASKVGADFKPPYSAFGVVDSLGALRGGWVFAHYTGVSVRVSSAGGFSVKREALRELTNYVFGQLGCVRMEAHTRRGNKAVRKQLPRLGFSFEGVAKRLYGDEDGLTYSLTIDDVPAFRKRWKL